MKAYCEICFTACHDQGKCTHQLHSCLTAPRVVELVEAAKDFLYDADDGAELGWTIEKVVDSKKAERLRTALEGMSK